MWSPAAARMLLTGNEAIARGLVEGGLAVAASYPGTPATEIMEALLPVAGRFGLHAEWSVNEKVAAEVAIAGSMCGLRSACSMKGVGLNVASEPIHAFTYEGAHGGFLLIVADDPSLHSSHTEQDSRLFARQAYLPTFEPSSPAEALEMARGALALSEKWGQPALLRTTTLVAHARGVVATGPLPEERKKGTFLRKPERWVNLPGNARRMRRELLERFGRIAEAAESLRFNTVSGGGGDAGVIACGAAAASSQEALSLLGAGNAPLLKLGLTHPIPREMVASFLTGKKRVLVVEEVEPVVETEVRAVAQEAGISVSIAGKSSVPRAGELQPPQLVEPLSAMLGVAPPQSKIQNPKSKIELPPRPPVLCPGCGHRNAFFAVNIAEKRLGLRSEGGIVRPSDIGCYTLGYFKPLEAVDAHLCMGSSIGLSTGFAFAQDRPVLCTIGDSTFLHAGIPALINAVEQKARIVVLVLDNSTTAMTGHQHRPDRDLAALVRACGVEDVQEVDGSRVEPLVGAVERALRGGRGGGVSVVVAKVACSVVDLRERAVEVKPFAVDLDKCTGCRLCLKRFACPAFVLRDDGKVEVDGSLCTACGACLSRYVCPSGAFVSAKSRGGT